MNDAPPIIATVPPRRKPGRPPRNPPPPPVPAQPRTPKPGCTGCGVLVTAISEEMVVELIRLARDRYLSDQTPPTTDMLYLAARLDGYCSAACWRHYTTPKESP